VQVPRLVGGYDVACVYVGANDARSVTWDAAGFERDLGAVLAAGGSAAARVVACTLPEDLGRPTAAPKPREANAIVRRVAAREGAIVVALDDLAGWTLVLPDAVHVTALGQVAIADRAAAALGVSRLPSSLAEVRGDARARVRWARRYGVLLALDLRRRAVERASR
jgi:hypothetical protein